MFAVIHSNTSWLKRKDGDNQHEKNFEREWLFTISQPAFRLHYSYSFSFVFSNVTATAHSLSAAICSTLGGIAVHHLGPRRVLLLQALPTIAGWLLMALANGFPMLLIGRCLVGACTGLSMSAGQVPIWSSRRARFLNMWVWKAPSFVLFFLVTMDNICYGSRYCSFYLQ